MFITLVVVGLISILFVLYYFNDFILIRSFTVLQCFSARARYTNAKIDSNCLFSSEDMLTGSFECFLGVVLQEKDWKPLLYIDILR